MAHDNVEFSYDNYETRSPKLADGSAKCRVEFERSDIFLRPSAAHCKGIDRTNVIKS